MINDNDIRAIGKFQKTHALKGELNAILDIDSDFLTDGNAIIVDTDGIYVPYFASSVRSKGSTSFLIKLDGIECEDEAKPFVNKAIYALKSQLAPYLNIEENELLDNNNFCGYQIIDSLSREIIGTISDIDSSTDNLLFIVEDIDGATIYVPAVDDFINQIDDKNKTITMTLPNGLIDLNK